MSGVKRWREELQGLPEYEEGWNAYMQRQPRKVPDGYTGNRAEAWRLGWSECELEHVSE